MRGAGDGIRLGLTSLISVVATGVIFAAASARADEQSDPSGETPRYFSLDRFDAYLEFEAEFDRTRVNTPVRQGWFKSKRTQTNRDYSFEERVGFVFGGTILDPGFITFQGDLSFALTQNRFEENGWLLHDTDRDNGYLLEYDLRANFFQGKKLSGSVYGRKGEDRIDRRFQPTLNEERTAFGTSWVFSDDKLPMELTYDYSETDRTGNRDPADDEHYTESVLTYRADWLITDFHRLKLSYEHAETKQEYQGMRRAFETTRDLFTLEHELEFGPDHRHSLRTLAHWQEESGDFARDFFEIGPQLTLKHTDSLETIYKYQFNRERYAGLDVESHRADFQLVHQVYSNLTTTVDVFGEYEDVEDDAKTTMWGGLIDWQYNRKNRWGHLYAGLALAFDSERSRADSGRRVIINESHTLRDPLNATLRNPNVVPGSIVVTGAANRRVYLPSRDYVIFKYRDVTQVSRVPTGLIADGETILVDYQFHTPADGEIDTVRVDFNLEQRFSNGLTPYYRFAYRDEDVNDSTGFWRFADRTDHHRLGMRYEQPRYALGVEYEIFDDTVEPYDAFHGDGLVHILQGTDHTLDASARLSRFFFDGGIDDRSVTIIDLDVDHRWRLSEQLSTFERFGYRWEDDSRDGRTNAWDASAGLEYVIGDLTAELSVDYDRLDLPQSDEDDIGVYLRIRRDIPNVLVRQ